MSTDTETRTPRAVTEEAGGWRGAVGAGLAGAAAMGVLISLMNATVLAGLVYGVVVWIVLAALVIPVWLSAVGFPSPPPFPNFAVPSLLWHLVYGAVLGAVYPAAEGL